MDKDKMNKAHDLDVKIIDYKSRINAITKSLEKDSIVKYWNIKITVHNAVGNNCGSSEFHQDNHIDYDVLKQIKEEVLICTERIKRIMDKEIVRLQTEFDNL